MVWTNGIKIFLARNVVFAQKENGALELGASIAIIKRNLSRFVLNVLLTKWPKKLINVICGWQNK